MNTEKDFTMNLPKTKSLKFTMQLNNSTEVKKFHGKI